MNCFVMCVDGAFSSRVLHRKYSAQREKVQMLQKDIDYICAEISISNLPVLYYQGLEKKHYFQWQLLKISIF